MVLGTELLKTPSSINYCATSPALSFVFICVWFSRQDFSVCPSISIIARHWVPSVAALVTSVHFSPLYGTLRLKILLFLAHLTKTHNCLDEFHSIDLSEMSCLQKASSSEQQITFHSAQLNLLGL